MHTVNRPSSFPKDGRGEHREQYRTDGGMVIRPD